MAYVSERDRAVFVDLSDQGWTVGQIARHLGITRGTAEHALVVFGIREKKRSRVLPSILREAVVQIDGIRCHYCGVRTIRDIPRGAVFSSDSDHKAWRNRLRRIDHKHPVAYGGRDELMNLVVACFACNARKSAYEYWSFRQATPYLDADDHPELPQLRFIEGG